MNLADFRIAWEARRGRPANKRCRLVGGYGHTDMGGNLLRPCMPLQACSTSEKSQALSAKYTPYIRVHSTVSSEHGGQVPDTKARFWGDSR